MTYEKKLMHWNKNIFSLFKCRYVSFSAAAVSPGSFNALMASKSSTNTVYSFNKVKAYVNSICDHTLKQQKTFTVFV